MGHIFDAIFGAAVLMVGIDAAESEGLTGCGNGLAEGGGVEETIVGVVVTDVDPVSGKEAFESEFGGDGGRLIEFGHEVNVCEVGEVVDKDGGACVTEGGGGAAMIGDESRGRTDELVDADNLSREGGRLDGTKIAGAFGAPRFAMGFAISASRAGGRVDSGEFGRNEAGASEKFEAGKTKVAEAFVVDEKEVLFALSG